MNVYGYEMNGNPLEAIVIGFLFYCCFYCCLRIISTILCLFKHKYLPRGYFPEKDYYTAQCRRCGKYKDFPKSEMPNWSAKEEYDNATIFDRF